MPPRDELLARLARRNAEAPEHAFIIPESDLLGWMARFEPPTADELAVITAVGRQQQ
jgi:hypothetical protein